MFPEHPFSKSTYFTRNSEILHEIIRIFLCFLGRPFQKPRILRQKKSADPIRTPLRSKHQRCAITKRTLGLCLYREKNAPARNAALQSTGLGNPSPLGPKGAHGGPWGPKGAHGGPPAPQNGPKMAQGGPWGPWGPPWGPAPPYPWRCGWPLGANYPSRVCAGPCGVDLTW